VGGADGSDESQLHEFGRICRDLRICFLAELRESTIVRPRVQLRASVRRMSELDDLQLALRHLAVATPTVAPGAGRPYDRRAWWPESCFWVLWVRVCSWRDAAAAMRLRLQLAVQPEQVAEAAV
jgi:hypothetical protein